MKFLYRPVKPWKVNQRFGADQVCFKVHSNGEKEYRGKRTEEDCREKFGSGWKSLYRRMDGHNGLDLRAPKWTPCYAAQNGRVLEVSTDVNEGLGVVLKHTVTGKNGPPTYWKTRYWHFIAVSPYIKEGKFVKTGDLLGYCDSTGRSTGDHLHFDLKQLDKEGKILNYDNGYFGAVNPTKYLYPDYAIDVNKLNKLLEEQKDLIGDFLSDLEALEQQMDPLGSATREYNEQLEHWGELLDAGLISNTAFQRAVELLTAAYREEVESIEEANAALQDREDLDDHHAGHGGRAARCDRIARGCLAGGPGVRTISPGRHSSSGAWMSSRRPLRPWASRSQIWRSTSRSYGAPPCRRALRPLLTSWPAVQVTSRDSCSSWAASRSAVPRS